MHRKAAGILVAIVAIVAACSSREPGSAAKTPSREANPSTAAADSLVLERTRCFGACPAYRLSVTADGRIRFQSRNARDSTVVSDSVAPAVFDRLIQKATDADFFAFPERIVGDRLLCSRAATDHPTVIVGISTGGKMQSVEDYLGCHPPDEPSAKRLERLRAFEDGIDSALGSSRLIRTATRR